MLSDLLVRIVEADVHAHIEAYLLAKFALDPIRALPEPMHDAGPMIEVRGFCEKDDQLSPRPVERSSLGDDSAVLHLATYIRDSYIRHLYPLPPPVIGSIRSELSTKTSGCG